MAGGDGADGGGVEFGRARLVVDLDEGGGRGGAALQVFAQALDGAGVDRAVVDHGIRQVLGGQALGLAHVLGGVQDQPVAGQRLQALRAPLRVAGDQQHAAALDDGRHAGRADRGLDGAGQLVLRHRRQVERDAHVVIARVELRHRAHRVRQLVPQRPADAAPHRLGHLGRVAPGGHAQARAAGAAGFVDGDGDAGRHLAGPLHQFVDQHVEHAGVGVHAGVGQALAHADLAARQPVGAGRQHGAHHVGQVEHFALLRWRVFAQPQHVLRGHAGLARALDRFGHGDQAAHQAGLHAVQAFELLAGGVERHGHLLAQLAHHVGPGQVGAAAAHGRPRVVGGCRVTRLAAACARFGGEPVESHVPLPCLLLFRWRGPAWLPGQARAKQYRGATWAARDRRGAARRRSSGGGGGMGAGAGAQGRRLLLLAWRICSTSSGVTSGPCWPQALRMWLMTAAISVSFSVSVNGGMP